MHFHTEFMHSHIHTHIYIYSLSQQHDFKASRWRATRMSRNLRVGELLICCDLVGQSVGGHLVRASVGSNVSHGQLSVILSDNLSADIAA